MQMFETYGSEVVPGGVWVMMDKLRRPSMHLRAQMSVGCCALYSMRAPSASGEVNLR